mmetsp:Transcript_13836/g.20862  ORF Transcript_13836/g.20862 Transcript_13836/m.20862 type:complete len:206 (+) Transcript_13836:336-953(+)
MCRHGIEIFRAHRVVERGSGYSVGIHVQCMVVVVVVIVTRLVVARIHRLSCIATPDLSFFLSLYRRGAGEQSTNRNTGRSEREMVGIGTNCRAFVRLVRSGKKRLKERFDHRRAIGRLRSVVSVRIVTVVDVKHVVGRANHVEIEIQCNIEYVRASIIRCAKKLFNIICGADQTDFLGGPPREPQLIGHIDVRHLDRRLEDRGGA